MGIESYFTTAASNTARWPENMQPSAVNNAARQNEADLRTWYNDADWREFGNGNGDPTVTYVSSTSFKIPNAQVDNYYVATRKVRAFTSSGYIYGVIASVSYSSPDTTVTVTWDSGSLANETIRVWLGNDPAAAPTPVPTVAMSAQLAPISWVPKTADQAYWNIHAISSFYMEGIGIAASIGSNTIWQLIFKLPVTLPAGTAKLALTGIAAATSGSVKINPKWNVAGNGEAPGGVSLTAEGVTTVTWGASDENKLKDVKITLDANTLTAGKLLIMDLTFETSGHTLAVTSTWLPFVIWE